MAMQAVVTPLIPILEVGRAASQIVCDDTGFIYTGFANFVDLSTSQCKFVPMNSNRSINGDVVHERVQANLDEYDRKGKYCEFGQINLLILDTDPSMTFLIMDGQHRVETMKRLFVLHGPARRIPFQFSEYSHPLHQHALLPLLMHSPGIPWADRAGDGGAAPVQGGVSVPRPLPPHHQGVTGRSPRG
eukprot:CAMPEP_0172190252 /NCGR_PEP_ID=MMETSP1050-20130122/23008_1 /TAXON_ID=233186 /ORGANISM="Cryptomonas curvata, Strain CCAP979/52" /LENGTH=187 /DNA_ID=CAMNT_0012865101 /DNA_START=1 /DNA_END=564 /DNA_ORIENTATION=+